MHLHKFVSLFKAWSHFSVSFFNTFNNNDGRIKGSDRYYR